MATRDVMKVQCSRDVAHWIEREYDPESLTYVVKVFKDRQLIAEYAAGNIEESRRLYVEKVNEWTNLLVERSVQLGSQHPVGKKPKPSFVIK